MHVGFRKRHTDRQCITWPEAVDEALCFLRAGWMSDYGLRVYRDRKRKKTGLYSFEQLKTARLSRHHAQRFRANRRAWEWFQAQAPWYRRTATFWVESAKQEATRLRRLAALIAASAAERPIGPLARRQQIVS